MVIQCGGMDPCFHSRRPLGLVSARHYFGASDNNVNVVLTMPKLEDYHSRDDIGGRRCPDC
jgi:hypothetical protein